MTIQNKQRHAKWVARNRDHLRQYMRDYRRKNLQKLRARCEQWKRDNPERYRACRRDWIRNRRRNDFKFRILSALRGRLRDAVRGRNKSASTVVLLGCPITEFLIYLESKFESGMTWENYGRVWHVDHIMPCAIFDLTKPDHQKRCFHFSNLQPMFASENLRKGAKITTEQFNLL